MIITVTQWAAEEKISRIAAYRRIRDHGIPFAKKGKIDRDIANRIWQANVNPIKQRAGVEGNRREEVEEDLPLEEVPPLFSGVPQTPEVHGRPQSVLGKVQLQRELLRVRREQLLIAEMEGRLVPLASVRAFEGEQIIAAREALLLIGPDLRDDLAVLTDPHKIQELIDRRVYAALAKLKEWKPKA